MSEEHYVTASGAKRSKKQKPWHLVPKAALDELVERLALGAEKYGENNWKKGDAEFIRETFNHLYDHVLSIAETGEINDAQLSAIAANWAFLCWFKKFKRDEFDKVFHNQDALEVSTATRARLVEVFGTPSSKDKRRQK